MSNAPDLLVPADRVEQIRLEIEDLQAMATESAIDEDAVNSAKAHALALSELADALEQEAARLTIIATA